MYNSCSRKTLSGTGHNFTISHILNDVYWKKPKMLKIPKTGNISGVRKHAWSMESILHMETEKVIKNIFCHWKKQSWCHLSKNYGLTFLFQSSSSYNIRFLHPFHYWWCGATRHSWMSYCQRRGKNRWYQCFYTCIRRANFSFSRSFRYQSDVVRYYQYFALIYFWILGKLLWKINFRLFNEKYSRGLNQVHMNSLKKTNHAYLLRPCT